MEESYEKIIVIISIVLMIIMSISLGYEIGQIKRQELQKENEIQELKKEIEQYKKR